MALLVVGLVMVITSRGCDGLGDRYAARLKAQYDTTRQQFEDQWESKQLAIDLVIKNSSDDRRELEEKGGNNDDELNQLASKINVQRELLDSLAKDKLEATRAMQAGPWRDLKIAARDADANNAIWSFWRGNAFVFGSLLLTLGLIFVGFNSKGAEQWICLTMLAIIVFSLYVGGLPWISGLNSISR
ncbi:MAG: hypothetical protein N2C12_13040 [Planctomycetales bacterium]